MRTVLHVTYIDSNLKRARVSAYINRHVLKYEIQFSKSARVCITRLILSRMENENET